MKRRNFWSIGIRAHSPPTHVHTVHTHTCTQSTQTDVKHSVTLRLEFAIGSTLTYLRFFGNVPLLHMFRYVTARDSVLPGHPPR